MIATRSKHVTILDASGQPTGQIHIRAGLDYDPTNNRVAYAIDNHPDLFDDDAAVDEDE